MAMAKITGQGLVSIAILVALLWTCIIGERVIARRAAAANEQALRAMRALRIKNVRAPAATPVRRPVHRRLRAL
jgi:hypothetical protein